MKFISSGLKSHLNSTTTTLATLFEILRLDGKAFHFTDHDQPIVYNGQVYQANSGFTRTAIINKGDLSVDNTDIQGLFDSELLDDSELRSGLFDYAQVFVRAVNYTDLSQGDIKLRTGRLGEVTLSDQGYFKAELRGLSQPLSQNVLKIYQPECRSSLGDERCLVPVIGPAIQRNRAVYVGETYLPDATFPGKDYLGLVAGGSFEQFTSTGVKSEVPGWSIRSGSVRISNSFTPYHGSYFLEGDSVSAFEIENSVTLKSHGIESSRIDSGDLTFSFQAFRANTSAFSNGLLRLSALSHQDEVISVLYDTGYESFAPGVWNERSVLDQPLPVGTRKLKVEFLGRRLSGSELGSALDRVQLSINDPNGVNSFWGNRDGLVYQVTGSGVTASVQPSYSSAVTDGTAQLEAKASIVQSASVGRVISRVRFELVDIDLTEVEPNFYAGGGLVFEDGPNRVKTHEVYLSEDNWVELFLPPPHLIAEGQRVVLWKGCLKTLTSCFEKFNNVINYQGEPHIPGLDTLTSYPDAQ